MNLTGRVAVVTGASSGLGAATARALAGAGVRVALLARRLDRLHELATSIATKGGEALPLAVDVTDATACSAAIRATHDHFGRLDILVNNAGTMDLSAVAGATPDAWRQMFETNVLGLLHVTQPAIAIMRTRRAGHIVNVGSILARVPLPNFTGYSMTKAAVERFTEGLRKELFNDRIRVTTISAGLAATEITSGIRNDTIREAARNARSKLEMLEAEDIAAAILYAVSQPERVSVSDIVIRPTAQEN